MKQFVIAGTLVAGVALAGAAMAQAPASQPPAPKPAAGAPKTTGTTQTADKPAAQRPRRQAAAESAAETRSPKAQPTTAEEPTAPGAMVLGTVRLPKGVKVDGKDIAAGSYQVRLTADEAKPDARGASEKLERWVEFVKGGTVVGREVVSIVPATEAKLVQKDTPPPSGGAKVETLKGGDYVRVWFNKAGNYYLVHLPNS
ncbi:MAG TPA: hypothetical protein VFK57_09535 [Vicinamibacterales bacterium]|nr:hypothetical protein [Vicinamibacterales bacterium]